MSGDKHSVLVDAAAMVEAGAVTHGETAFVWAVVKGTFKGVKKIYDAGGNLGYRIKGRYSTKYTGAECPKCLKDGVGKAKIVIDHPEKWFHDMIARCVDCSD